MMTDRTMVYIGLVVFVVGVLVLIGMLVLPPDTWISSHLVCYKSPQDEVINITARYSPQKLKVDAKMLEIVEKYASKKSSVKYPSLPKKIGVVDPFVGH